MFFNMKCLQKAIFNSLVSWCRALQGHEVWDSLVSFFVPAARNLKVSSESFWTSGFHFLVKYFHPGGLTIFISCPCVEQFFWNLKVNLCQTSVPAQLTLPLRPWRGLQLVGDSEPIRYEQVGELIPVCKKTPSKRSLRSLLMLLVTM